MMRYQTGIGEWKMIRYLKESGRITGLVSKIFMRFRRRETMQDSGLGR